MLRFVLPIVGVVALAALAQPAPAKGGKAGAAKKGSKADAGSPDAGGSGPGAAVPIFTPSPSGMKDNPDGGAPISGTAKKDAAPAARKNRTAPCGARRRTPRTTS